MVFANNRYDKCEYKTPHDSPTTGDATVLMHSVTSHSKQKATVSTAQKTAVGKWCGTAVHTDTNDQPHYLMTMKRRERDGRASDVQCYLCRLAGLHLKTTYACTGCKKAFHVDCFTVVHNQSLLNKTGDVYKYVNDLMGKESTSRRKARSSTRTTQIEDIVLPSQRKRLKMTEEKAVSDN